MDGVLFLSNEIHHLAFQKTLHDEQVELLDYSEIAGLRTDIAIKKIFSRKGKTLSAEKLKLLVSQKRNYAYEMIKKNPPVAPNCRKVLSELYSRGILLALASSSSNQNVQLFLDSSFTREFFTVILSGEDIKYSKPNPEIFRKARKSLGIISESCYVIEDSKSGILGAQADKMNVIGVVNQHSRKDLLNFGAFTTISKLDELLQKKELLKSL